MKQKVVIIGYGFSTRLCLAQILGELGYEVSLIVLELVNSKPIDCYSKYVKNYYYIQGDDEEKVLHILLDKCKSTTKSYYVAIIDKMYKDGYFREGIVELDPQHEMRNYEKSIKWIEEGIIPEFLKEDMRKYMQNDEIVIEHKNSFLIED